MIGVGKMNGIEVEHVCAERLNVIQLGTKAMQIAALKIELLTAQFGIFQIFARLGRLRPITQHLG